MGACPYSPCPTFVCPQVGWERVASGLDTAWRPQPGSAMETLPAHSGYCSPLTTRGVCSLGHPQSQTPHKERGPWASPP